MHAPLRDGITLPQNKKQGKYNILPLPKFMNDCSGYQIGSGFSLSNIYDTVNKFMQL